MNDQDLSAPDLPPEATPPEAVASEPAKRKRPPARNKAATATDADAAPAKPARRSRKSVAPVDDGPAQQRVPAPSEDAPARKAPARKRAPRKSSKASAAADTAPVVESPASTAPDPLAGALDVPAEAAEAPAVLPADAGTPAKSASLGDSQLVSAEHAGEVEPQSDALAAGEVDEDDAAETAEALGDAPARRKRRRRKRKDRDLAEGEAAAADPQPLLPDLSVDEPADVACEALAARPKPAVASGRVEVIGFDAARGLAELDRASLAKAEHVLADAALVSQLSLPATSTVETLPARIDALLQRLAALADRRVAVVTCGDPACEGPGRELLAALGPARIELRPAVGRVQAALARVGLALDEAMRVDLAAVGLAGLVARLRGGRLYAVTLDHGTRPQDIGRRLEAAGFHQARVWLLEPGAEGPVHALLGFELSDSRIEFTPGTVLAIYTAMGDGSLNDWPGVAATALRRDALPEALRLLALAWLQPTAEDGGWAIEPGEAAVAIDWSRHRPAAPVFAIGSEPAQLAAVRLALGAGEGLQAVRSGAHRSLAELPDPDLVFIRASEELGQQIRTAWERLLPGGRMVVVAEDEQARVDLMHFANRTQPCRWQEVSVAEGGSEGGRPRLEPARAARIMLWKKPPRG